MQKELARGAEAVIYASVSEPIEISEPKDKISGTKGTAPKYMSERSEPIEIIKDRIKKSYRVPELDKRLRSERTRMEARLINEAARAGVSVPKILSVDKKENKITMEFIEGEQAKNAIPKMSKKELEDLAYNIGTSVGKLHYAGLIHGDLTTSNMILHDNKLYLIDFGLGQQSAHPEDQGTDLAVLHESLRAAHFKQMEILWPKIIEGYKSVFPQADKVLKALHSIEMRGRYMRRSP